jgi:hypothetical protein
VNVASQKSFTPKKVTCLSKCYCSSIMSTQVPWDDIPCSLMLQGTRFLLPPTSWLHVVTSQRTVTFRVGSAIAQAVSSWLPTATARVRAWVRSCGICSGRGRFSPSTSISPANLHSINCSTITITICVWYNNPAVAAVPSGLNLTH